MKIIETFLCGKENNPQTCEDGLVLRPHLVAVFDGVTAKGTRLWEGKTSGCYAKCVLEEYLQGEVEKQDAVELLQNLDHILREAVMRTGEKLKCEEYPRAAIILYNDFYKEIWAYGDCQCRINGEVYTHSKKIDELNADLRAYYLEYQLMQADAGMEMLAQNDVGRQAIQQNLLMQFAFENKPGSFGYLVLNGMGIEESMIRRYPVQPGDTVALASDGYPVLGADLQECEARLAQLMREDPLCFRAYRSTKGRKDGNVSFDDRAYCRLVVEEERKSQHR